MTERRTSRRWPAAIAVLLTLAVAALLFGLITALAGGDRSEPAATESEQPLSESEQARPEARLWRGDGFRLARVRSGSRVRLHARPEGREVERVGARTEFGSRRAFLVLSRRGDWLKVLSEAVAHDRSVWIRADHERLRFETTPWSVHASLGEREVELRRDDEVVRRFEVTVGAAGTETPAGRFAVTDVIVGGLNPVYGCCAIALTARQRDLPDEWIGGDRVALHGTSGPVGQAASNGCIRAADEDVAWLAERVVPGTPFIVD